MSRSNPIPTRDRKAFVAAMSAIEKASAGLAGSYWQLLDAAEEFMLAKHYQRGDPLAALKQYRRLKADGEDKFPGVDIDAVHRNPRWAQKG